MGGGFLDGHYKPNNYGEHMVGGKFYCVVCLFIMDFNVVKIQSDSSE